MEHADQVQRVITVLKESVTDETKGALVMTYENIANHAVGEVHILSAKGTPYPQLLAMFVACMHGVVGATGVPMEKLMDDIAELIDDNGVSTDASGSVH